MQDVQRLAAASGGGIRIVVDVGHRQCVATFGAEYKWQAGAGITIKGRSKMRVMVRVRVRGEGEG